MSDRGNLEFESIESLLGRAFAPVDPPARMYEEFENRLTDISFSAAEEIADWELAAMGDLRNWVRPALALAAGTAAAGALVVLGLRHQKHEQDAGTAAVRAMADALGEAADGAREDIKRAARDLTS